MACPHPTTCYQGLKELRLRNREELPLDPSLLDAVILTHAPDDHSAHLTLTHYGQTVSYLVRFNEQDEMVQCETQRYQGDTTLLPWVGRFSRYRVLHGVRVPTRLEASWVADGQRLPYARFRVLELAYHELHPF